MGHLVVAAAFENIGEADDVAVDVGVRILQRVANTGLRGQVNDLVELFGGENASMPVRSATSSLTKRKPAWLVNRARRFSLSETS
jgi:hypothetical protein